MGLSFRVSDFALRRVAQDTDPDAADGLLSLGGDGVLGQIQPINFGGIEHLVNESAVGNAVYRYFNKRVNLPDLTFTLVQANQHPESFGPATMQLLMSATWQEALIGQPAKERGVETEFVGFFMNPGSRVFDLATDSPRILTFVPFKVVIGGRRAATDVYYNDRSLQDNAATSGAMVYLDTSRQIYRTRINGTGPVVDHMLATRNQINPPG